VKHSVRPGTPFLNRILPCPHNVLLSPDFFDIEFVFVPPFEIYHEFPDGVYEDPDTTEMLHIGKYMNGIYTLQRRINIEYFYKFIANRLEDIVIQSVFRHDKAHVPDTFWTDTGRFV
jgi:hypothetical protein